MPADETDLLEVAVAIEYVLWRQPTLREHTPNGWLDPFTPQVEEQASNALRRQLGSEQEDLLKVVLRVTHTAARLWVLEHLRDSGRRRRRRLEKILREAQQLQLHLSAVDMVSNLQLVLTSPEGTADLGQLAATLELLCSVLSWQLEHGIGAPGPQGRSVPASRQYFVRRVVELWEKHTGTTAGYGWKPNAGEYSGDFLDFASAVAALEPELDVRPRDFVEWIKARNGRVLGQEIA